MGHLNRVFLDPGEGNLTAENNKNSNTRVGAWGEGMLKLQIDRCISAIVLLSTHIFGRGKNI